MKKRFTYLMAFLLLSFNLRGAIIMVEVEDFEFDPAVFTCNVGDTIMWIWEEGFHTTTSTNIPAGAMSWDSPISSSSPAFIYVVTTAGSYSYQCTPHASMNMLGAFTANVVTSVEEIPAENFLSVRGNFSLQELNVSYGLAGKSNASLRMFDMLGNPVRIFEEGIKQAGTHEQKIGLDGLAKGIYIVELTTPQARVSRKILLQ